jgi:hypothetical protein
MSVKLVTVTKTGCYVKTTKSTQNQDLMTLIIPNVLLQHTNVNTLVGSSTGLFKQKMKLRKSLTTRPHEKLRSLFDFFTSLSTCPGNCVKTYKKISQSIVCGCKVGMPVRGIIKQLAVSQEININIPSIGGAAYWATGLQPPIFKNGGKPTHFLGS